MAHPHVWQVGAAGCGEEAAVSCHVDPQGPIVCLHDTATAFPQTVIHESQVENTMPFMAKPRVLHCHFHEAASWSHRSAPFIVKGDSRRQDPSEAMFKSGFHISWLLAKSGLNFLSANSECNLG